METKEDPDLLRRALDEALELVRKASIEARAWREIAEALDGGRPWAILEVERMRELSDFQRVVCERDEARRWQLELRRKRDEARRWQLELRRKLKRARESLADNQRALAEAYERISSLEASLAHLASAED
jgi:hypothetical protein